MVIKRTRLSLLSTAALLIGITLFISVLLIIGVAQALPVASATIDKIGPTYAIAEENAIEAIQKKLTAMQQSGELAELEKKAQERMTQNALHLPAVEGLQQC